MKKLIWISSTALILILSSCGEEAIPSAEQMVSATVDTIFVFAADTIGSEFGEEAGVFAFLVACDFTPDGNIAALDAQKISLQVFDPAGTELMQVGSSGQGPGEYQMPLGMAIMGSGYVVSDMSGGKLIRYNSDGSFRDEINNFGMMPPSRITGTTGGKYLAEHLILDLDGEDGPEASIALVAFGDTSEPDVIYADYPLDMQGGRIAASIQFHCAGGLDGEVVLAEQSDSSFVLSAFSESGEEIFRIVEEWDRIPYTEEELAEDQLSISLMITEEGTTLDRNREPREDQYRTVIEGAGVDSEGRIWVQMGDTGTPYFRVYSSEGDLQTIAIPDESVNHRATFSISPYGFLAFDSDPDDWPKIYLLEVTE